MHGKYIFSSDIILPVSSEPLHGCSVAVRSGKIVAIGTSCSISRNFSGYKRIKLGRGILLPGFVNAHVHLELEWMKKSIREFTNFTQWLKYVISAREKNINASLVKNSVEKGIRELTNSGVTTVGEISSFDGADGEILKKSGIRTVLFKELIDRENIPQQSFDFSRSHDRLEIRPFPHAPYSCTPELISKIISISAEEDIPFSMHLAESPVETDFINKKPNEFENYIFPMIGRNTFSRHYADSPVEYLFRGFKDLYKTRFTAVHMVQVNTNDVGCMRNFDVGIVLCPRSNVMLGVGEPPIELYSGFRRIGIGTDSPLSNWNLDYIEEMKCFFETAVKHKIANAAEFTVYASTLGGARALFIDKTTGSIEKGKDADLVFIRTEENPDNYYEQVVHSDSTDIKFVMAGGKVLKAP